MKKIVGIGFALALLVSGAREIPIRAQAPTQADPVVERIIHLGTTDNQVMKWNDIISNRFGGRETGTNAYTDATQWLVWQLKQWGVKAELEEIGELPVGYNRGPWFGKMLKPTEKTLRFGTPSFTAGTKGVQRGPVVILAADPYTAPRPAAGAPPGPPGPGNDQWRRDAVQAGIAEIAANKAKFKGAWVLIGGTTVTGRDGRRPMNVPAGTPPERNPDVLPLLAKALVDAGALGTIQSSVPTAPVGPNNSEQPLRILDGYASSWDALPQLPDIKLLDSQYKEVKTLVEKNEPVTLEFEIRNWFKMGPIKYHNVVATIPGSTYPDEYVVMGGHFDSFSGGTGAVDDGSGWGPTMEAMRLLAASGARPKRSIIFISFGAEESGLLGSQAWLKKHPELQGKIVLMINRDGDPSAINSATVPSGWYADFERITAPLKTLDARWPFTVRKTLPRARPAGGSTDSASFQQVGVPAMDLGSTSVLKGPDGKEAGYNYNYGWHTLTDVYSELVPYTEYQQHSALATAVVVYGVANLDKPLTREGVFLGDGLYATITVGSGDSQKQIMTTLDYEHAPLQVANFIRIAEGNRPAAGRGFGPGGPGGPGGPPAPAIGSIAVVRGVIQGVVSSETQKAVAVPALPRAANTAIAHDAAGVIGVSGPNTFYLTLAPEKARDRDRKLTAIGKVMANADELPQIGSGDEIRSIRITRVGKGAIDFKTDDASFKTLMEAATAKKK